MRRADPTRRSTRASTGCAGIAGQIESARALRSLLDGSAIRASHRIGDARVQDPYCLRCQPQVMGACLDVLRKSARHAADRGERRLRQPADLQRDADEALSGGNFHAEPVAFAADMMALALCEIGSLAERRVAMLVDPVAVRPAGVPDPRAGPQLGLDDGAGHGGGAGVGEQAARPSRQRRFDPHLGQPGGPRVDGGARLAPAAADGRERDGRGRHRTACAAQGCDFLAPLASSPPLEAVRRLLREQVAHLDDDRHLHPDIEKAIALVRSGAVAGAPSGWLCRASWRPRTDGRPADSMRAPRCVQRRRSSPIRRAAPATAEGADRRCRP